MLIADDSLIPKKNLKSSLLFYLLWKRSKIVKGFKRDKFYLEVSRGLYICSVIELNKISLQSIYSARESGSWFKICNECMDRLLTNHVKLMGPM